MNRKLLASNIGICLLLVVGLVYVSLYLVRFDPLNPRYTVTVMLERTGGLYFNSDVTYLGQPIGDVTAIEPHEGVVRVRVSIRSDVEIPKNTEAVVAGLSPVGEQYLDFQPRADGGPYLADGDTIPLDATKTPVEFATMMRNVAMLAEQIDPAPIRTVLDELSIGLGDPGTDLGRMVIDADRLLAALEATQPEMLQLLRDGEIVLSTADSLRPQLAQFSTSARRLTQDIRAGDAVWRKTVQQVPPDLDRVLGVVRGLQQPLASMLDNVDPTLSVLTARGPALRALLSTTGPSANLFGTIIRDGWIQGLVSLTVAESLCRYVDGTIQQPWINKHPRLVTDRHCQAYGPDLQQRGSYNAPRP